jgi:hypothetical protein
MMLFPIVLYSGFVTQLVESDVADLQIGNTANNRQENKSYK